MSIGGEKNFRKFDFSLETNNVLGSLTTIHPTPLSYGKPDHQASETVISESDEVMAGDGVMMGTDGHR